jgi:hypothetical protein
MCGAIPPLPQHVFMAPLPLHLLVDQRVFDGCINCNDLSRRMVLEDDYVCSYGNDGGGEQS